MTGKEIEDMKWEYLLYIADKIKDIQIYAVALKNPEDFDVNAKTYSKIQDAITEIHKAEASVKRLEMEIPDEEE